MNEELDRKLRKKLETEERKNKLNEIREKNENKYVIAGITFFGTLLPLYLFFFMSAFIFRYFFGTALSILGISIAWITPFIHGAIWIAAVISVIRNRSVLEEMIGWI